MNPDGAEDLIAQLLIELRGQTWRLDALCAQVDPNTWFPEKGGTTEPAKRVCAACPARLPCLEYALDENERFGIFGGLSERQRRPLARERQRRDRAA